MKWIRSHPVLVSLLVVGAGSVVTFFVAPSLAIAAAVGSGAALGISRLAAGEAPWKD